VPRVSAIRTYLELCDRSDFRRSAAPQLPVRVERILACPVSFFRYLYAEVGRRYHWHDRLAWSEAAVRARVADPTVSLHMLSVSGAPAGYFELERHTDGSVEIAYFGLLPEYLGRGLGKYLLSEAVEAAWAEGASRLWLHTCTLDDRAALPNYLARGFRVFKSEEYGVELPA
jgi:GNAT superfamily N-acetyltransferase